MELPKHQSGSSVVSSNRQNVIRDKWHDVDDQTVRKAILQWKRRLAAVAKHNGGPISTFSADQLTDTNYCDVLV